MDEWHYDPANDLNSSLAEQLRSFPREPNIFYYTARTLAAVALRVWLKLYHRLEITGREHLPASGPFILAANHTSHLDTLCLLATISFRRLHQTFPAAASDYFFSSLPRSAVSAILINALPFDRQVHGEQSLQVCQQLLANGDNILILFPEGTRTVTGEMGRFRLGIAHLAIDTNIPVVPCYLHGGFAAWPKGCFFPRPRKITLTIGGSLQFPNMERNHPNLVRICHDLQAAVQRLA